MHSNTMITELPEVREHLAQLEAQYRHRLANAQPRQRKLQSASAGSPLTITIPIPAEIIQAVKAAETDAALPALKQDKPERRRVSSRRKKAPNRVDEAAA